MAIKNSTKNHLHTLGFDTDFIAKIESKSLNLQSLKTNTKTILKNYGFTEEEIKKINEKLKRQPIDRNVIENIKEKSNEVCCFCANGDSTQPYQIHHISEYYLTQNNDEDNLMLVCPTHHTIIHSEIITQKKQHAVKKAWESTWNIAKEYKKMGITFPFGSFENIDYTVGENITEVFSFNAPSGNVCRELTKGKIADECKDILSRENKLIIAGNSGSGKTTLALGLAGSFTEVSVFLYINTGGNPSQKVSEIAMFLSCAKKEIILLIDDANSKLEYDQLQNVLKLASVKKKIIVVCTRNTFVDHNNENLEAHFKKSVKYLSWENLSPHVKNSLLNDEKKIIDYLDQNNINDFSGDKIGFGKLDYPLEYLINKYVGSTQTVWQFIYMLGGGLKTIEDKLDELYSNDRFDIIVFYIALKQISKVEEGTSIDEILDLYKRNNILNIHGPPEVGWIKRKLEDLCKGRVLVDFRGRYKTVHREYARNFIEISFHKTPESSSEILNEIFTNLSQAKEIVILCSWLKDTKVKHYLKTWCNNLKTEDWIMLGENCFAINLNAVYLLTRHLDSNLINSKAEINHTIFINKALRIAELVNKGEIGTLYYFSKVLLTLKNHCSDVISEIIENLNTQSIAKMIKDSNIDSFDYISSMLRIISEFNHDWILNLRANLSFSDFKKILNRNQKGQLTHVFETISFYRIYIANIKRSEFKQCIEIITKQLSNCELEEINYPTMPSTAVIELFALHKDLELILNSLDIFRLIKSFEKSSPRYWGSILALSQISKISNSTFARSFTDGLDFNIMMKTIEMYYLSDLYSFRLLIHQLAFASEKNKKQYAARLKPLVINVLQKQIGKWEHEFILKAFVNLDEKITIDICLKFKKAIPQKKLEFPTFMELKHKLEEEDKSGKDYNMLEHLI